MPGTINYFDPDALFSRRRRKLPHFCQEGAAYFVTFRLGDSIPQARLDFWRRQYEQWLQSHPSPHTEADLEQVKELGIRRVERFLDRCHGACLLKEPTAQDALETLMRTRDGVDYDLGDYVIMPNHVHVLFRPIHRVELAELLGPWRSLSAKQINNTHSRCGALWQEEYFDHIVRSPDSLLKFRHYIHNNPANCRRGTARYNCGSMFSSPLASSGMVESPNARLGRHAKKPRSNTRSR